MDEQYFNQRKNIEQNQHEITYKSNETLNNSNENFKPTNDHAKKEIQIKSLTDIIQNPFENINKEVFMKIRYLITEQHIDPRMFKINLETGMFYNIENSDIYEVKRNHETGKYEININGIRVYKNNSLEQNENNIEKEQDSNTYNNIKVRRLIKSDNNNAAFTKIGFLLINILTFITLITMMLLLNK